VLLFQVFAALQQTEELYGVRRIPVACAAMLGLHVFYLGKTFNFSFLYPILSRSVTIHFESHSTVGMKFSFIFQACFYSLPG
jgi:hypothetical protein